jgi:hypothetical protein
VLLIPTWGFSQTPCIYILRTDSCILLNPKLKEVTEVIEVKIKNNYLVQFIKQGKLNYLKIIVRDDLGFGKKGSLQLLSGKKQIYIKSIKLEPIDKTSAYFIIELNNSYYLDNIKDLGLSKIVFNETVEFNIPKPDSDQIKKAADCFYAIVKDQIWPASKKL